jgi:hypothetical protein
MRLCGILSEQMGHLPLNLCNFYSSLVIVVDDFVLIPCIATVYVLVNLLQQLQLLQLLLLLREFHILNSNLYF